MAGSGKVHSGNRQCASGIKTKNKSSAANARESTRIKERIYAGSTNNHRIVAKCHEKLRRDCRAEGSEPGRTGRRAAGGARTPRSGQDHTPSRAALALAARVRVGHG